LKSVLEIYLHLLECPEDIDGLGHLTAAERKKERGKLKKKKTKEEEETETAVEKSGDDTFTVEKLLPDALDWCSSAENVYSHLDCSTLSILSEVYIRGNKPLQALRPLVLGYKKDPRHPEINVQLTKFLLKLKGKKLVAQSETILTAVKQLVQRIFSVDLNGQGHSSFIANFQQFCLTSNSLEYLIAGKNPPNLTTF
jgi:hypothetical protein